MPKARYPGSYAPEQLRRYAKEKGFTYQDMADLLDITRQTYAGWLSRKQRPTFQQMFVIEHLTGCPLAYWLGDKDREWVNRRKHNITRLRRMHPKPVNDILDKAAGRL